MHTAAHSSTHSTHSTHSPGCPCTWEDHHPASSWREMVCSRHGCSGGSVSSASGPALPIRHQRLHCILCRFFARRHRGAPGCHYVKPLSSPQLHGHYPGKPGPDRWPTESLYASVGPSWARRSPCRHPRSSGSAKRPPGLPAWPLVVTQDSLWQQDKATLRGWQTEDERRHFWVPGQGLWAESTN